MSMLDSLVSEALSDRQDMSALRSVVEKELLHHGILPTERSVVPWRCSAPSR
jgi:hypothetical protein